jgi:ABC-type antimicrobial peptide transport system permease subunit
MDLQFALRSLGRSPGFTLQVDPVGQNILCGLDLVFRHWMKIVGVVRDVHMEGPTQASTAEIGFSAMDPRPYLVSLRLLVAISLAAAYLPAWRASRLEPLEALREE